MRCSYDIIEIDAHVNQEDSDSFVFYINSNDFYSFELAHANALPDKILNAKRLLFFRYKFS